MIQDDVLAETKDRMAKARDHLQGEFGSIRTGRASPIFVEKLKVDYYGSEVPLQQLAGFSVPEPRLLVISPYDKIAPQGHREGHPERGPRHQPAERRQDTEASYP